jgi:hypothetical protein
VRAHIPLPGVAAAAAAAAHRGVILASGPADPSPSPGAGGGLARGSPPRAHKARVGVGITSTLVFVQTHPGPEPPPTLEDGLWRREMTQRSPALSVLPAPEAPDKAVGPDWPAEGQAADPKEKAASSGGGEGEGGFRGLMGGALRRLDAERAGDVLDTLHDALPMPAQAPRRHRRPVFLPPQFPYRFVPAVDSFLSCV